MTDAPKKKWKKSGFPSGGEKENATATKPVRSLTAKWNQGKHSSVEIAKKRYGG